MERMDQGDEDSPGPVRRQVCAGNQLMSIPPLLSSLLELYTIYISLYKNIYHSSFILIQQPVKLLLSRHSGYTLLR